MDQTAPEKEHDHQAIEKALIETVDVKERRKLRARRERGRDVWFGLGMFGVVGWSVSLPILVCLAVGIWIDQRWPSPYSWTLMLLFIGTVLGCLNAWYWVTRERSLIGHDREEDE